MLKSKNMNIARLVDIRFKLHRVLPSLSRFNLAYNKIPKVLDIRGFQLAFRNLFNIEISTNEGRVFL